MSDKLQTIFGWIVILTVIAWLYQTIPSIIGGIIGLVFIVGIANIISGFFLKK